MIAERANWRPIFIAAASIVFLAGCPGGNDDTDGRAVSVFLWGDSIRVGYEPMLVELAGESMEIWSPTWYNGMTAGSLLENLNTLYLATLPNYDVFHLNVGIHDSFVLPLPTPDSEYEANWREIIEVIQASNSGAPIILATSTSSLVGNTETILRYNDILRRIAIEYTGVSIDDLYAVQHELNLEHDSGGLHFTDESSEQFAIQVLISIEAVL